MRLLLALALFALLTPAAAAVVAYPEAEVGDGPMRGRCLSMRSAGIALTLAYCLPRDDLVEWVVS